MSVMTDTAVTTAPVSTPTTWRIDPTHANVEFAVRHLMISTVRGRFSDVAGTVTMTAGDPATAVVDVTIGAASIDTREPQRDAHLRSADFFDVERFPVLTFTSRRVERVSGGGFTLIGDLTVHGVTREVALRVDTEGTTRDPWGHNRSGFSAKTVINRKDFGLHWNQLLEAGGVAVGDEIKIAIDLELVAD